MNKKCTTLTGLWVFLMGCCLFPALVQGNTDGWKSVLNKSGIELFQRDVPGKPYQQQRGSMLIDGSLAGLIDILDDASLCAKWLYGCRSSSVVKQISTGERINYTIMDAPFILADRDMYIRSVAAYDSRVKAVTISLQGLENYDAGRDQRVRVKAINGFWRFQQVNDQQVKVDYQMYNDPQIKPVSAVNSTTPNNLYKTFSQLRQLATSSKYKAMPIDPVRLKAITVR